MVLSPLFPKIPKHIGTHQGRNQDNGDDQGIGAIGPRKIPLQKPVHRPTQAAGKTGLAGKIASVLEGDDPLNKNAIQKKRGIQTESHLGK